MQSIVIEDLIGYVGEIASDLARGPRRVPSSAEPPLVGVLVEESSTRTRLSTFAGAARAGISAVDIPSLSDLSTAKGESLADTAAVLGRYFDAVAVRSRRAGLPSLLAGKGAGVVFNLGDGSNEHPSQALATMVHAHRRFGELPGLHLALWGDLELGRVAHSVFLGAVLSGMRVTLVAPDGHDMPAGYLALAAELCPDASLSIVPALDDVDGGLDVLYVTRRQWERRGQGDGGAGEVISPADIERSRLVLHPLPRGPELPADAWSHSRASIMRHVDLTYEVRRLLLIEALTAEARREHPLLDDVRVSAPTRCANAHCVVGMGDDLEPRDRPALALSDGTYCGFCLEKLVL
jgi:aspartate carbamoyltransferase catalytic subunit